jgi:alkaline phosphatase
MTEKAIKILGREKKGFFLLVEGGKIDHGHHENLAKAALHEVKEFHDAIEKAQTLTSDDDTLIVVTADHSHTFTMGGYPARGNPILAFIDSASLADSPPTDKMPVLTLSYANGVTGFLGRANLTGQDPTSNKFRQPSLVPMAIETHGGEDVAIYARGPMSHLFHGVQEQSYIPHVMAYASCVGQNKAHCRRTRDRR